MHKLVLIVGFVSLTFSFPSNINISTTGDIKIVTINGILYCDTLKCPLAGIKCTVSKKTTSDLLNVITERKCYNKDDKVVKEKTDRSINQYPNTEIDDFSTVMKSMSNIYQCRNCNGTNSVDMKSYQSDLQSYQNSMQAYQMGMLNYAKQMQTYLADQLSQAFQQFN